MPDQSPQTGGWMNRCMSGISCRLFCVPGSGQRDDVGIRTFEDIRKSRVKVTVRLPMAPSSAIQPRSACTRCCSHVFVHPPPFLVLADVKHVLHSLYRREPVERQINMLRQSSPCPAARRQSANCRPARTYDHRLWVYPRQRIRDRYATGWCSAVGRSGSQPARSARGCYSPAHARATTYQP